MDQNSNSIFIDAPQQVVFDCLNDPKKMDRWMGGMLSNVVINSPYPQNPLGTKFKQTIRGLEMVILGEVVDYEYPKRLGVNLESLFGKLRINYYFELQNPGTMLSLETIWDNSDRRVKFSQGIWRPLIRSLLRRQLKGIKVLAEEVGRN
jgi:hypothetical protein